MDGIRSAFTGQIVLLQCTVEDAVAVPSENKIYHYRASLS
jgi:hypothetical protein